MSSCCSAASPVCRCVSALPDRASEIQVQQDLWIQCDDCNKWRELSASQFEQVKVYTLPGRASLHSTVTHFAFCICLQRETRNTKYINPSMLFSAADCILAFVTCRTVNKMHVGHVLCCSKEPPVS